MLRSLLVAVQLPLDCCTGPRSCVRASGSDPSLRRPRKGYPMRQCACRVAADRCPLITGALMGSARHRPLALPANRSPATDDVPKRTPDDRGPLRPSVVNGPPAERRLAAKGLTARSGLPGKGCVDANRTEVLKVCSAELLQRGFAQTGAADPVLTIEAPSLAAAMQRLRSFPVDP